MGLPQSSLWAVGPEPGVPALPPCAAVSPRNTTCSDRWELVAETAANEDGSQGCAGQCWLPAAPGGEFCAPCFQIWPPPALHSPLSPRNWLQGSLLGQEPRPRHSHHRGQQPCGSDAAHAATLLGPSWCRGGLRSPEVRCRWGRQRPRTTACGPSLGAGRGPWPLESLRPWTVLCSGSPLGCQGRR